MNASDTPRIPGVTDGETAPWFAEPWQAKAFAMTVSLHAAGVFSWTDWAEALSTRLHGATALPDGASSAAHMAQYYAAWFDALEEMTTRAGLTDPALLAETTETWQRAALATPHGTPIRFEAGLTDHG
ncbi:nitrile hydratase accessory protein [Pseudooceanicola nanhaiensis]|uniref:nitrile hydratase accessory protein n=1 Tax=Pseudooceanicola nanhaiensis TaxID=375761 RepID=UPI00351332BF